MAYTGLKKWRFILIALAVALTCLASPAIAASNSSKSKQESSKQTKAKDAKKKKESKKAKKSKPTKNASQKAQLVSQDDIFENAEPVTDEFENSPEGKKVTIKSNDPKGFTKALLYEKEGVEVEVEFVDLNQMSSSKKKKKTQKEKQLEAEQKDASTNPDDYIDFSTMLVPVTHEALLGSRYGIRDHRLHRGVDVQVIKEEPVVAAYPGKVIVSKYNKGGYGHYVLLQHENNLQTLYGHLSERSVKVGDEVFPGDIVGLAGNSGKSSGAHLHFEIRYKNDINIDPATVINFPKWELQPGAAHMSKKKILNAHYNMQKKLKSENLYIVKAGDTIEDVANWFYISVDAVRRINGLKKDQPIRVGMRLKGCK